MNLLRGSSALLRCFCTATDGRMKSIAEELYKGQLTPRILSYPISHTPDDATFAKVSVKAPVTSEVLEWRTFSTMEVSGLWEKLNSLSYLPDDQQLFLSGFLGPRPVLLSGAKAPEGGKWAHVTTAAFNQRGSVVPKYRITENNSKVISGHEDFVLNASQADHFVVWAAQEGSSGEVLAFLVPRTAAGLTVSEDPQRTSVSSLEGRKVTFDKVEGTVLGEGLSLYKETISKEHRIVMSARILGKLIRLFNATLGASKVKKKFGDPYSEIDIVQNRLAGVSGKIYALQSTLYLVSGLVDSDPIEFELDATLLQILSESIAFSVIRECTSILGVDRHLEEGSLVENIIRDIEFTFFSLGISMDMTKCYASLLGLQGLGKEISDVIRLRRNGMSDPMATVKDAALNRRRLLARLKKKKTLGLSGYVNDQFEGATDDMEDALLDFRIMLESSLAIHGRNVQHEEGELTKMADYASELLALVSIISRLNLLSTTPGGYRKDYEKCLGYSFMREASVRLEILRGEIGVESRMNNQKALRDVGDYIFDQAKYPCVHPITKNKF